MRYHENTILINFVIHLNFASVLRNSDLRFIYFDRHPIYAQTINALFNEAKKQINFVKYHYSMM